MVHGVLTMSAHSRKHCFAIIFTSITVFNGATIVVVSGCNNLLTKLHASACNCPILCSLAVFAKRVFFSGGVVVTAFDVFSDPVVLASSHDSMSQLFGDRHNRY